MLRTWNVLYSWSATQDCIHFFFTRFNLFSFWHSLIFHQTRKFQKCRSHKRKNDWKRGVFRKMLYILFVTFTATLFLFDSQSFQASFLNLSIFNNDPSTIIPLVFWTWCSSCASCAEKEYPPNTILEQVKKIGQWAWD